MLRSYFIYIAVLFSSLLISCSSSEEKQQLQDGDKTYNDFRNFVAETEKDAEAEQEISEIDTITAREELNELKLQYDSFEQRIAKNQDQYTPIQREVLLDTRERFKIAIEKKQKRNEEISRRYKLRQEMLGIEVNTDDLSEITPANIKGTYQNFVKKVSENKSTYTDRDWNIIEGFWTALNSRKTQLQEQLKPADATAIAKLQEQYKELHVEALNRKQE